MPQPYTAESYLESLRDYVPNIAKSRSLKRPRQSSLIPDFPAPNFPSSTYNDCSKLTILRTPASGFIFRHKKEVAPK